MLLHSNEYSWVISYEYLPGWLEPTENETLSLYCTVFIQRNLLTADIPFSGRLAATETDEMAVKLSQQNLYVADALQQTSF